MVVIYARVCPLLRCGLCAGLGAAVRRGRYPHVAARSGAAAHSHSGHDFTTGNDFGGEPAGVCVAADSSNGEADATPPPRRRGAANPVATGTTGTTRTAEHALLGDGGGAPSAGEAWEEGKNHHGSAGRDGRTGGIMMIGGRGTRV